MKHYRGLTLAEVLAAIVIVAVVVPVAMQGISIATGLASLTRQRAQATSLAESKLDEIIIGQLWQGAQLSGDFAPQFPEYHWQADVSDWEEADMKQIQLHVSWVNRGKDREIILSTLVYNKPEVSSE
jgi:prepilin-type N-terminal cleavage/methylation domain-containing protein